MKQLILHASNLVPLNIWQNALFEICSWLVFCGVCSELYHWNHQQCTQRILKSLFAQSSSRMIAVLVASWRALQPHVRSPAVFPERREIIRILRRLGWQLGRLTWLSSSVHFHCISNEEKLFSIAPPTSLNLLIAKCCTSSPVPASAITPESRWGSHEKKSSTAFEHSPKHSSKHQIGIVLHSLHSWQNRCQCWWNQYVNASGMNSCPICLMNQGIPQSCL